MAISIIGMLGITIFPIISMCIYKNMNSGVKDEEFNIARGICEKFKSEQGNVKDMTGIYFINDLQQIPQNITEDINTQCKIIKRFNENNYEYKKNKYAVLIKTSCEDGINIINVTVKLCYMKGIDVTLCAVR